MKNLYRYLVLVFLIIQGCTNKTGSEIRIAESQIKDDTFNYNPSPESKNHILNCVETSGHHVYKEELNCPLGGEKFTALRLGTHSTYGRYLDWEPASYMRFPVPIPVCPSNGFVMAKETYTEKELLIIKSVIEKDEYQTFFKEKHASFYLYAKTKELLGEDASENWWLYLNATWEADLCGDKARYREYAIKMIQIAEKKLANCEELTEDYWVLSIIIPNMYRRIGDFDSAMNKLGLVGEPSFQNKDNNEYFNLAKVLLRKAIEQKNIDKVRIVEVAE